MGDGAYSPRSQSGFLQGRFKPSVREDFPARAFGPQRTTITGRIRLGEPAANPYLYFASQIYCGLDGLDRRLALVRAADTPYEAKADLLPRTLEEALYHLKGDKALRDGLGTFIDYYCRIKEAEIARFNLEVSDWEHREYFDLF